jgi:hypothetical protein
VEDSEERLSTQRLGQVAVVAEAEGGSLGIRPREWVGRMVCCRKAEPVTTTLGLEIWGVSSGVSSGGNREDTQHRTDPLFFVCSRASVYVLWGVWGKDKGSEFYHRSHEYLSA